jgi:hypothetical protein
LIHGRSIAHIQVRCSKRNHGWTHPTTLPIAQCLEATRAYYVRAARPNQKAGKAAARRDEHAGSAVWCHRHSTQVIRQRTEPVPLGLTPMAVREKSTKLIAAVSQRTCAQVDDYLSTCCQSLEATVCRTRTTEDRLGLTRSGPSRSGQVRSGHCRLLAPARAHGSDYPAEAWIGAGVSP